VNSEANICSGTLLGESVRPEAPFEGVPLTVTRVHRKPTDDDRPDHPDYWTFIEFRAPADRALELADILSRVLIQEGGWYCDFRTPDEVFVVFHGKIFKYRRGDRPERAKAEAYGRLVGLPEAYLDWPE
jgi:hypothetical protein